MFSKLTIGFSTRKINNDFLEHIKKYIGLKESEYEIIPIENNGIMSLSKAYNTIIDKSNNDIVVLIHDDIKIEQNWGLKLLKHFNKNTHDIIGVAGTTMLPKSGQWWEQPLNMKGIVKHSKDGKTWVSKFSETQGYDIHDVVILDGLFLAFNKNNIKHKFDEEFNGFHFYDLGFTFPNYLDNVKIGVITDIRVTHYSIGETNNQWEENRKQFIEKYSDVLNKTKFGVSCLDLVSIIIPCYNDGKYLLEAIESSDSLIYENKEVIVINDGSIDPETNKIISDLKNNRLDIKVIEHITNKGLPATRNTGIKESKGKYILPHDSDDTFNPNYLILAINEIKKDTKISPVYCDTNHIGFIQGVEQRPEWSLQRLKKGPFIVSCSLFSKESWESVNGYDETMKGWEDYDLWWRMGNKGYKGIRIPHPLFNYRHIRPSMIQDIIGTEQNLYNYIMSKPLK